MIVLIFFVISVIFGDIFKFNYINLAKTIIVTPKKSKKAKEVAANKAMAAKYKRAYTKLFKDLPLYKQKRVKEDPSCKEGQSLTEQVIKLAEK